MTMAVLYFGGSVIMLASILAVFRIEDARGGERLLLGRIRTFLDRAVVWFFTCCKRLEQYIRHSFVRLFFHYVAHRLLKRLYMLTHFLEEKTEDLLRQNRRTARRLTAEKHHRSHLDEIAEHQEETSLTEAEIQRMRSLD